MNKYKNFLVISALITLFSCASEVDHKKSTYINANQTINDTVVLSDGHLYYYFPTPTGYYPIHSQYCKNHKDE